MLEQGPHHPLGVAAPHQVGVTFVEHVETLRPPVGLGLRNHDREVGGSLHPGNVIGGECLTDDPVQPFRVGANPDVERTDVIGAACRPDQAVQFPQSGTGRYCQESGFLCRAFFGDLDRFVVMFVFVFVVIMDMFVAV